MQTARPLILGEAADDVRRLVGLSAWSTLEAFAARAVADGDRKSTATSIRELAAMLGVTKNTVHRAVRRLVAAGLVRAEQHRSTDGRYVTGRYLLTVPSGVLRPYSSTSARASATPTRPRPS